MSPTAHTHGEGPGYGLGSFDLPEFAEAVLDIVDQIPAGKVLAYGDVAELLGEGGPRQVGAVMSRFGSAVPWWRVTRATGDLPVHLREEALAHWRAEGTALVRGALAGRRVDLTRARWDGEGALGGRGEDCDQAGGEAPSTNQCDAT